MTDPQADVGVVERFERVDESVDELLAQVKEPGAVRQLPGSGRIELEWTNLDTLLLLMFASVFWLLPAAAAVKGLVVSSSTAGHLISVLVLVGLAPLGWLLVRSIIRAAHAKRRVVLEQGRMITEKVVRGDVSRLATIDMDGVDAIRVCRYVRNHSEKLKEIRLMGPGGAQETDLGWSGDEVWPAKLIAAFYELPFELADFPVWSVMADEELGDIKPPPKGCTIDGDPRTGHALVCVRRWKRTGLRDGLIFILFGAAAVAIMLWAATTGILVRSPSLAVLIASIPALGGLYGVAWHFAGRVILELEPGGCRLCKELLGLHYGRRTVARADVTEVGVQWPGYGVVSDLHVHFGPRRTRMLLPGRGARREVVMWVGKVVALWAGVPFRPEPYRRSFW
jgi:hypothetical protein